MRAMRLPSPTCWRRCLAAERERSIDDADFRVDLQRARLHGDRARLLRRPGMPVDDHGAHARARELVGEHQAGRPAPTMSTSVSIQRRPKGRIFPH